MRLTLLTAVGLALVTNLIPGCKPRIQIEEAARGRATGQTPPQPPVAPQPAESPSAK